MITYFTNSGICLLLLIVTYHLFLEKEKMHTFNRFYLLFSIVFSLLIPFIKLNIDLTWLFQASQESINQVHFSNVTNIKPKTISSNFTILFFIKVVYGIGFLLMVIRFCKNLFTIAILKKKGSVIYKDGYKIILLDKKCSPHSFLKTIFINKESYKKNQIDDCLFEHEKTHIKQKHSLDILFIEFIQIIFWFNPILYFYNKAIKLNHEFLADAAVINSMNDNTIYTKTLLQNIFQNNPNYLTSSLNYSLTKKRFIMMTKNKSKTRTFLKQCAVIPLFICFILLFSTKTIAQNKGVSKALIEEYESKLHSSNGSVIIKGKDVKRLYHIYSLMSEEQKAKATKIPPPPPPILAPTTPTLERAHDVSQPPSVPEPMDVNEIAPPPPIPPNPTDHMIEMAKKGATFYFEGKKISSDRAIEITKSRKNINIQVIGHDSKKPVVKLSKQPITVED